MIYPFVSLQAAMIAVGVLLLLAHGYAWMQENSLKRVLLAFPRSKVIGNVLLVLAATWFFWLVTTMDLGEFSVHRRLIQLGTGVMVFLCLRYADEFLAVRSLGALMLLAAEVPVEAAFMRPEPARLLLVSLAYAWVIAGIFWVGKPYLLRDLIRWATGNSGRWKALCAAGMLYGAVLVGAGLFAVHGR